MDTKGVYIGRFSPIHIGHEAVIHTMLEAHRRKNCVVVIGSSNAQISQQNMFSYTQRRRFIQTLFPGISIIGMPDYWDDRMWLTALSDILTFAGFQPQESIFYGGDEQEHQMELYREKGWKYEIVDRHSEVLQGISSTRVKSLLRTEQYGEASKYLNPEILQSVMYAEKQTRRHMPIEGGYL